MYEKSSFEPPLSKKLLAQESAVYCLGDILERRQPLLKKGVSLNATLKLQLVLGSTRWAKDTFIKFPDARGYNLSNNWA